MKDPIACRTQSSVCVYLSKGNISASRLIFTIWNGFLSACNQLDDDLMEKELTRDANVIINEYPVAPISANSLCNVLYEILDSLLKLIMVASQFDQSNYFRKCAQMLDLLRSFLSARIYCGLCMAVRK